MASGLAAGGKRPFVAIYSTFLQRAFDEILHDAGIMRLPVVFCVDRCGLVGEDGETHQGLYDLAMLKSVPDMAVYMPSNACELRAMLRLALDRAEGPTAIRYSRGRMADFSEDTAASPVFPLRSGADITILAAGRLIDTLWKRRRGFAGRGKSAGVLETEPRPSAPARRDFCVRVRGCSSLRRPRRTVRRAFRWRRRPVTCRSPSIHLNRGDRYIPQATVARAARALRLTRAWRAAEKSSRRTKRQMKKK